MILVNNISAVWLEISMIPFLLVMSAFLSGRMATTSEINRRFLRLVISTLAAACFEVGLELFTDMSKTAGLRVPAIPEPGPDVLSLTCILMEFRNPSSLRRRMR